jgi:hypothetical protein
MMTPTVGRVVYYNLGTTENPKLLASIIAYVWSETVVNLMVIDENGIPKSMTSINRASVGDSAGKWDWMPYQKQKASDGNNNSESAEPRP